MSSIKQLAIKGTIWTVLGYGIGQILRFGTSLVLARLLSPNLFGLMALVTVFITGLNLFSDLGIAPSVIRSQRNEDPAFVNTAWTVQVVRSGGIWVCCWILAWPVSHFYQEPQLLWLFPIVGLNSFIHGFYSTGLYLLNRQLSVKQIALYELTGQLVFAVVTITWAYFNKSIWALLAGSFASSIYQLVRSHQINPGKPNRFAWDASAIQEIISFGRWIFLSTALTFMSSQSDRLVLGKLFPLELLGIYGIAFALAEMPKQVNDQLMNKVVFPTYTKFVELPRHEFRAKINYSRIPFLVAFAIGLGVLISCGDIVISTLYDKRYADAAWMLPILAIGIWPTILNGSLDAALFAIGNPRYIAYGCFWSAIFLIGGMILGFHWMGPFGAVIAVAISNIPSYVVIMYGLWKEKLACLYQDFWATVLLVAVVAFVTGIRILMGHPPVLLTLH
jgi:O-antigen/teichoic acid export membrane protein